MARNQLNSGVLRIMYIFVLMFLKIPNSSKRNTGIYFIMLDFIGRTLRVTKV